MFLAELFTIGKIQKQPKCHQKTNGHWRSGIYTHMYMCVCIYIYMLSHKEEWDLAVFDNMNGPSSYYAKQNKSKKDNYRMIPLIQNKWKNKTET